MDVSHSGMYIRNIADIQKLSEIAIYVMEVDLCHDL